MEVRYALTEGDVSVQVLPAQTGYTVTIVRPGQPPVAYQVQAQQPEPGRLVLRFAHRSANAWVARANATRYVALDGHTWRLQAPSPRGRRGEPPAASLTASMPGKVLDVLVTAGQEVDAGAALVVLEAMKMELRITAPAAGRVAQIHVQPGDVVDQGQKLVDVEAAATLSDDR